MTRHRRTMRPSTDRPAPQNAITRVQDYSLRRALVTVLLMLAAVIAIALAVSHLLRPTLNVPATSPSLPGRLSWRTAGPEPAPRDAAATQIKDSYGSFAPLTASGKGPALLVLPDGVTSGLIKATHSGTSRFEVTCLSASGQETADYPVTASGNYEGTTVFGVARRDAAHQLLVEHSEGESWTLTVSPVFTATPLQLPASGVGDHVFLYVGAADQWRMIHSGERTFYAFQFHAEGWLPALVIHYGPVDDFVQVNAGPSVITVESNGPWRIVRAHSGTSPTPSPSAVAVTSPSAVPTSAAPRSTP